MSCLPRSPAGGTRLAVGRPALLGALSERRERKPFWAFTLVPPAAAGEGAGSAAGNERIGGGQPPSSPAEPPDLQAKPPPGIMAGPVRRVRHATPLDPP